MTLEEHDKLIQYGVIIRDAMRRIKAMDRITGTDDMSNHYVNDFGTDDGCDWEITIRRKRTP